MRRRKNVCGIEGKMLKKKKKKKQQQTYTDVMKSGEETLDFTEPASLNASPHEAGFLM